MALRKRSADCASRPIAFASTVPGERVTSASIARTLNCSSWLSVSARSASRSSSGGAWLAASKATAITGSWNQSVPSFTSVPTAATMASGLASVRPTQRLTAHSASPAAPVSTRRTRSRFRDARNS